jgi:KTSC domain
MSNMVHVPVNSSNIKSVAYDAQTRQMQVRFTTGATYQYENVEPHMHNELMMADSKGRHFAAKIKGKLQGQQLP